MRSTFARPPRTLKIFLIFASVIFFTLPSFAARVAGVKGNRVLIQGNVKQGQLYYTTHNGKRTGIVRVVKVQGNKAIANILKGKAAKGFSLVARPRKKSSSTAQKAATKSYDKYSYGNKSSSGIKRNKEVAIGGVLGMVQSSAEVSFTNGSKASLSGSGMSFKAMGDYGLTRNIFLRGYAGTQPFEATEGARICDGRNCAMTISYMSVDLWGRYVFNPDSNMRFWGGGGIGLLFPLNTDGTNAVVKSDISSTMLLQGGGGMDWYINEQFFIPLTLEYNLIPPSDDVSTSMISIRAGLGMKL